MLTEAQYITFILGFAVTIAAILLGLLYNNSRLNDVNARFNDVNARLTDLKDTLRAEIRAEIAASQQVITGHLVDIISKIAGLDSRITRLETRLER